MYRLALILLIAISPACRTAEEDSQSASKSESLASDVAQDKVFEIKCKSPSDDKFRLRITSIGRNRDKAGKPESVVEISGYGKGPISFGAPTVAREIETLPVTYSWDFQVGEVQIEVSSRDNRTGKAVLVRGTGKETERREFTCDLFASGVKTTVEEPSVGMEDVNRIECTGPNKVSVLLVNVGKDLNEDGTNLTEVRQKNIEYLPDEFIAFTNMAEIEANPVIFNWTFKYRESFIEINSKDNVTGLGVVFAEAPGDSIRVEIACKLMSLVADAITEPGTK